MVVEATVAPVESARVIPVSVVVSIGLEKVAVTAALRATFVAPPAGALAVTTGDGDVVVKDQDVGCRGTPSRALISDVRLTV